MKKIENYKYLIRKFKVDIYNCKIYSDLKRLCGSKIKEIGKYKSK
jgi:hypothetical protein